MTGLRRSLFRYFLYLLTMCQYCAQALTANDWSEYVPQQISDGIIHVKLSDDLPKRERVYAQKFLNKVDEVIDPPVQITNDSNLADIIVDDIKPQDADSSQYEGTTAAAMAYIIDKKMYATWRRDYFDSPQGYTRSKRLTKYFKRVIGHEILHTFGLSHPNNNGKEPGFDVTDTIMSYNKDENFKWHNTMGPLDVAALEAIWNI